MATANEVVSVAQSQVGYKEGRNNDNKYGREYGLNNAAYCCIGMWWCFKHANASSLYSAVELGVQEGTCSIKEQSS